MSNVVDHARRELELCGQTAEDPGYAASLVATVAAFASYGHSGGSADMAIGQLTRLLRLENLAPLTDDPADWLDQSIISGTPMWQHRRNPKAISYDAGTTFYLVDEPHDGPHARWYTSIPHHPTDPMPVDPAAEEGPR